MLWLLALLPAVFATWQPFYVDTRANQVTSVGFSLQNYGSYTPGLPNVTVIWGGNVSAPICVGNPDCSGMQAVQITLGNDGKAPVVSDVWALSFPSPGAGSSWPVVATARHVGALDPHVGTPTTPGNPDVMVMSYVTAQDVYLADFATTETATTPFDTTPLWSTTIATVTGETGEYTPITLCDDSSRAFYIRTYQYYTYLWGVNATTGDLLLQFMTSDTQGSKGLGISASRDGLFLAVSILDNSGYQVTVRVFDVANRQWRDENAYIFALPVGQPQFMGHLCPMGQFLAAGTDTVILQAWNNTAGAYEPSYVFGQQGSGYYFATAATSVNGEGANSEGCLLTLAWINPTAQAIRVDLVSMLSGKSYVSWLQKGVSAVIEAQAHLQYSVVAFEPLNPATAPVLALFSAYNPGGPVQTLTWSGGAPVGADIVVFAFKQPPMLEVNGTQSGSVGGMDTILVTVAGSEQVNVLSTAYPSHF